MPTRPTLGLLRASRFPLILGIDPADISTVAVRANECQERLIIDPLKPEEGWWGGYVDLLLNLAVTNFTALAITPMDIAAINYVDICQRPKQLRNGFYEYLQFGRGKQPPACTTGAGKTQQAFQRGTTCTLVPFPTTGPQIIRVFPANKADVGRRIVFQGPDQNGITVTNIDPVTGETALGEYVPLQSPFSQAVNRFQNITGIVKDITIGPVQVFTVDPNTQAQTLLTTLQPNETVPMYREYFFNAVPPNCCNTATGTIQVWANCKVDFVPVVNDIDYLTIQCIPALLEEAQSVRYSPMDSEIAAKLEAKHHTKALQLLNGQIDHFEGKRKTAIGVPIFGSDRLQRQPV